MRKLLILVLPAIMIVVSGCSHNKQTKTNKQNNQNNQNIPKSAVSDNLVFVKGGIFKNKNSNLYGKGAKIADFYIGKYEVTQKEWKEVMGSNPSKFKGDSLPVEMVNWYDCIEYCNKRSEKAGLKPYYNIDKKHKDPNNKSDLDTIKWTVTINPGANGYRLPTEAEWEYAASGGQLSKNYEFSGSNDPDSVAWYWQNCGDSTLTGVWTWSAIQNNHDSTKPVGSKAPNELGLYDMSGNVREWCFDWYQDFKNKIGYQRVERGGGWIGAVNCCQVTFRGKFEANGKGPDQGLRVCRNI